MQRRTGGDHEGTFSKVNGQWKPLEGKMMSRGGMLHRPINAPYGTDADI